MKKALIFNFPFNMGKTLLLMGLLSLGFIKTSEAESVQPGVSFQIFYDELLPYGDWIYDPVHGYVWVPYADNNFQPYASNGYWVMTSYGNTWVSHYDWGWAPFHYGRWYFDDYLGWAWVPGYEWGPAWVNWRAGAGYYGWAPLGPGMHIHVSVNIPSHHWVFVPRNRLISRNIYNYYIPRRTVYKVYNQTTIINNTYVYNNRTYVSGPPRREIERVTRRSVPVYQVNNSNKPGRSTVGRNVVEVYKPEVRQSSNNSRSSEARPSRVVTAREHKANVAQRSTASAAPRSSVRANTGRDTENASRRSVTRSSDRNGVGTDTNRAISGENVQRSATPTRRSDPPTQSPSRESRSQAPAVQQQSAPRSRVGNAPTQMRSGSQNPARERSVEPARSNSRVSPEPTPRTRSVQSARPATQVRSQEAQRSRSTGVSSGSSRRMDSGTATGRSDQRSRSSRGGQ